MKKGKITSYICLCIAVAMLLSSCTFGNSRYEKRKEYGPTVEFFMYPKDNGNYDGYRFIYDRKTNRAVALSKKNVHFVNDNAFYSDSKYLEEIRTMADQKELGDLKEYLSFGEKEFALLHNDHYDENTLAVVQNGKIDLLDIATGSGVSLSYYDSKNEKIYLKNDLSWNKDFTEYSGKIYTVDLKTKAVEKQTLCVYNAEIDQKFNISSQFKYPISDWKDKPNGEHAELKMIADGDNLMMCVTFSPLLEEPATYGHMNLLISYNISKNQPDAVTVVNEDVCCFQKNGDGYVTFSKQSHKEELDKLDRLWMTEYDSTFKPLKETEIPIGDLKDSWFLDVCSAGEDVFIGGATEKGNILAYYNIATKEMKFAKKMPKGSISNFRLIQKIDGIIYNIQ